MKINNFFKLIISIGISQSAGLIGSFFTFSAIPDWYSGLTKPALNPPNWVFGPAWITLYTLMGIAFFLIWLSFTKASGEKEKRQIKIAFGIFGLQLLLNATWSIIFFGLQIPAWALVNIILLWVAILITIFIFYKISKTAAYLLIPYILWVSFAGYLNYAIWILN